MRSMHFICIIIINILLPVFGITVFLLDGCYVRVVCPKLAIGIILNFECFSSAGSWILDFGFLTSVAVCVFVRVCVCTRLSTTNARYEI